MNSYITGSQAYGYVSINSDIDLVVTLPEKDLKKLWAIVHNDSTYKEKKLIFGNLNLVAFNLDSSEDMCRFYKWKAVHDRLVSMRPVTKEFAISQFREAGAELNYTKEALV